MGYGGFLVMIFLPTFAASNALAQEQPCKLRKDKDDIKVYACHTDTSRLKSIRAEMILSDITASELKAYLMDVDNYVTWQYNLQEAQVLERINDSEVIMRTVIDAPWPVSNRESITRMTARVNEESDELKVEGKVIAHDYPPDKGLVRVPFSRSSWSVSVVNGNDLKVSYFLNVDPGGSIPAWLVNLAVAEGPYESFRNLKRQLSEVRQDRN